MNGKWQYFLNSLATVGGNVFLLCFFVIVFLALIIYVLHGANANDRLVSTVSDTFMGFSGALLLALKGRTTDQNPSSNGGGGSTTSSVTTTHVITPVPAIPQEPPKTPGNQP